MRRLRGVRALENSRACQKMGTDLSVPRRRNPAANAPYSVASGRGALWAGLSPFFRPVHSARRFHSPRRPLAAKGTLMRAASPLVFWMRPIAAQIAMKTVALWGRLPTCGRGRPVFPRVAPLNLGTLSEPRPEGVPMGRWPTRLWVARASACTPASAGCIFDGAFIAALRKFRRRASPRATRGWPRLQP